MKQFLKSDSNDVATFQKTYLEQRALFHKRQAQKELFSWTSNLWLLVKTKIIHLSAHQIFLQLIKTLGANRFEPGILLLIGIFLLQTLVTLNYTPCELVLFNFEISNLVLDILTTFLLQFC
jgi:hypothetical protein